MTNKELMEQEEDEKGLLLERNSSKKTVIIQKKNDVERKEYVQENLLFSQDKPIEPDFRLDGMVYFEKTKMDRRKEEMENKKQLSKLTDKIKILKSDVSSDPIEIAGLIQQAQRIKKSIVKEEDFTLANQKGTFVRSVIPQPLVLS